MKSRKRPKILVIGGGTGTYTVLQGLKHYPVDLSVIVSMTDSGGSNRVIRDEFGLLPTSDLRQCMVALASDDSDEILRNLFTYRYSQGTGIQGMSFGNLFMAALTDIYGSQEKAIKKTCEILQVKGNICPVTYDNSHLVARYENGVQILGEHNIDEPKEEFGKLRIVDLEVFPKASPNPDAIMAIKEADLIVLGPGDLYTSIICNLVVNDIASKVAKAKAKKVYIMNLMTKFGQTHGFKASNHVLELEKYLGKGILDYVIADDGENFPKRILKRYHEEHAYPVKDDLGKLTGPKVRREDIISSEVIEKHKSDKLIRSLIRHDSKKLARAIMKLL